MARLTPIKGVCTNHLPLVVHGNGLPATKPSSGVGMITAM